VIVLVGLGMAITSLGFPGKARLMPLLASIIVVFFTLMAMVAEQSPKVSKFSSVGLFDYAQMGDVLAQKLKTDQQVEPLRELDAILWTLALCGLLFFLTFLIGFIPAVGIFCCLCFRFYAKLKWLHSFFGGVAVSGFTLGFESLFNFQLFKGILFGEILPPL
jgi:hypothetical protein